jgi:hypothetical protein
MDWTSIAFLFDRIWAVSPTSLQGATRNQVYFAYLTFLLSYRQHLLRTAVGTDGVTGGDGVTAKTLTPAMRELMEHPMLGPDLQAGTPGSTKGGEAAVDADAAVLVVLESLLSAVAAETGHTCPIPFMPQHYRKQYTATFASFKHDINTSFFQSDVFRLLKVSTPPREKSNDLQTAAHTCCVLAECQRTVVGLALLLPIKAAQKVLLCSC